MNKKLFIRLAPLLAIAAFVVLPGASQAACTAPACPHVYKNGVIGGEGKPLREILWGTLKIRNKTLGEIECHTVWGGFLQNPTGGGAAKGQVQGVYAYECVDETCTKVLGGKAIRVTPGNLPWLREVIEPKPGEFREKIGHKGPTLGKEPNELTEPEFVEFTESCEGITAGRVFGEQDPRILNNGTSIGSGPGELKFEPESSNPESHNLESEVFGTNEIESISPGIKVLGYGTEELIEVKNP
jgi:hypothetical protein